MNYILNSANVSNKYSSIDETKDIQNGKLGSVLEQIASSYTKIPDTVSKSYNIDNCSCPSCGCFQGNLLLVLSPAGVVTATTISMSMSAIE